MSIAPSLLADSILLVRLVRGTVATVIERFGPTPLRVLFLGSTEDEGHYNPPKNAG
jgi:hypothetical protein